MFQNFVITGHHVGEGGEGGLNRQKIAKNDKKILSVAPYISGISGTIYHVIFIYSTHV